MNPKLFADLWKHHPGSGVFPCDDELFANQCAIRMGVALEGAGIDSSSFGVRRCATSFPKLKDHKPGHILAAQELADALVKHSATWGRESQVRKLIGSMQDNWGEFKNRKGIVFIQNGWGSTDHIDLWDGVIDVMKGGDHSYRLRGEKVWFWRLA